MLKESEKIYYKSLDTTEGEGVNDLIIQLDKQHLTRIVIRKKNQEIACLRQQLVEVAAQIWQSEQLMSKLAKHLDLLGQGHFQEEYHKAIRSLLKEFKSHLDQDSYDNNLVIDQEFVRRLQVNFPRLSSNDLRICSLLRLNLSTKEVAQKLGISPESANKARYRIRKKLNLSHEEDLIQFIIEY